METLRQGTRPLAIQFVDNVHLDNDNEDYESPLDFAAFRTPGGKEAFKEDHAIQKANQPSTVDGVHTATGNLAPIDWAGAEALNDVSKGDSAKQAAAAAAVAEELRKMGPPSEDDSEEDKR